MVNRRLKSGNGVERFSYMEVEERYEPDQCVIVRENFEQEAWRDVIEWLTQTPGLTGKYWATPAHWDRGERVAMFIFSDRDTAIAFKLRWC